MLCGTSRLTEIVVSGHSSLHPFSLVLLLSCAASWWLPRVTQFCHFTASHICLCTICTTPLCASLTCGTPCLLPPAVAVAWQRASSPAHTPLAATQHPPKQSKQQDQQQPPACRTDTRHSNKHVPTEPAALRSGISSGRRQATLRSAVSASPTPDWL